MVDVAHRGLLGIHAGRSVVTLREKALDPSDFVLGAVVGVVELVDVIRGHASAWAEDDCWNWVLSRPRRFIEPMPLRGALGLFTMDIPASILSAGQSPNTP